MAGQIIYSPVQSIPFGAIRARNDDGANRAAEMIRMFMQDNGSQRQNDQSLMLALISMLTNQKALAEQGRQFDIASRMQDRIATSEARTRETLADLQRELQTYQLDRDKRTETKSDYNDIISRFGAALDRLRQNAAGRLGTGAAQKKTDIDLTEAEATKKATQQKRGPLDEMGDILASEGYTGLTHRQTNELETSQQEFIRRARAAAAAAKTPAERTAVANQFLDPLDAMIRGIQSADLDATSPGEDWKKPLTTLFRPLARMFGAQTVDMELKKGMVKELRSLRDFLEGSVADPVGAAKDRAQIDTDLGRALFGLDDAFGSVQNLLFGLQQQGVKPSDAPGLLMEEWEKRTRPYTTGERPAGKDTGAATVSGPINLLEGWDSRPRVIPGGAAPQTQPELTQEELDQFIYGAPLSR